MRILWVSFSIVLLDQVTKILVKGISVPSLNLQWEGMSLGSSRPILGDLLRLTYIENPGMAFGIDIGGKLFFSIFTVIASIAIAIYMYTMRSQPFLFRFSLATILGGACGNLIDRVFYATLYGEGPLFYGKVVDFIDIDFFNVTLFGYHFTRWPVFNIADASVSLGVILLLFAHQTTKRPVPLAEPLSSLPDGNTADPASKEASVLSGQKVDPSDSDV